MMKGSIYRYHDDYILIYKVGLKKWDFKPAETCAIGVSLVDSTDIRTIAKEHWKYWKKVE
jgi:hypothetical protein